MGRLNDDLADIHNIMKKNIEEVLNRGERLDRKSRRFRDARDVSWLLYRGDHKMREFESAWDDDRLEVSDPGAGGFAPEDGQLVLRARWID